MSAPPPTRPPHAPEPPLTAARVPAFEELLKGWQSMRGWLDLPTNCDDDNLKALGAKLPALIAEADLAVEEKTQAENQKRDFNPLGERPPGQAQPIPGLNPAHASILEVRPRD